MSYTNCSHSDAELVVTGEHDESTEYGTMKMPYGAMWCPQCGCIRDKDGNWREPKVYEEITGVITNAMIPNPSNEASHLPLEDLVKEKWDDYEPHIEELANEIPSSKATKEEIGIELIKYVEKFMVALVEAKRSVLRKFGVSPIPRKNSKLDPDEEWCPECGMKKKHCICFPTIEEEKGREMTPEIEESIDEVMEAINQPVAYAVVVDNMFKLLERGVALDMAKKSLISTYTFDEGEEPDDGNPCRCGVTYKKMGIIWWCPKCCTNFVME